MGLRAARLLSDARLAHSPRRRRARVRGPLRPAPPRRCSASAATWSARRDEAEDALQQIFLRAHRALLAHGAPDDLRPWLFTIARNRCQTLLAARRRRGRGRRASSPATDGLAEEVQARADLRAVVERRRAPARRPARGARARGAGRPLARADRRGDRRAAPQGQGARPPGADDLIAERERASSVRRDREQSRTASARRCGAAAAPALRCARRAAPIATRSPRSAGRSATVLPVAPSHGLKAGVLGAARRAACGRTGVSAGRRLALRPERRGWARSTGSRPSTSARPARAHAGGVEGVATPARRGSPRSTRCRPRGRRAHAVLERARPGLTTAVAGRRRVEVPGRERAAVRKAKLAVGAVLRPLRPGRRPGGKLRDEQHPHAVARAHVAELVVERLQPRQAGALRRVDRAWRDRAAGSASRSPQADPTRASLRHVACGCAWKR